MIACLADAAGAVDFWNITIVDSVGGDTSLAILPSGQPAISYFDATNADLKYAWYDGSTWHTTTVDSIGTVGRETSLAILPSGHPAISYQDWTNADLKYAWYDGSAWHATTVDSAGDVGKYNTSLAILPSGQPAISYFDYTNKDLKYAWYDGSAWQTSMVDTTGFVGHYNSLAILPLGYPAISYQDYTNKDLKYAWYDGSIWQTNTVDSIGSYSRDTSLAILPSGHPAISYHGSNENLKYAWYDGSAWQTTTADSGGSVGEFSSLAVQASGQPAISYCEYHYPQGFDLNLHDLKYARYDGGAWQTTVVDSADSVGEYASLAIMPSGQPAISYYDEINGDLKFATPSDIPCAPVAMASSWTSTATTDIGGTTVVIDGTAFNEGTTGDLPGWASSSVSLETTNSGHLRGLITLTGRDGAMNDPPEYPTVPCEGANGIVTGTIVLGTSESYPAGSDLDLDLQVLVGGDPGYAEDYHLKFWRGPMLIAQIDPSAPDGIVAPVFAGETLTFELFASEEGPLPHGYDRSFEFRLILQGPANFDGIGRVDFRDYAIFGLHWLDIGCNDPTWCGKTDLDKSGDVNLPDLKIFAGHWLE